MIGARDVEYRIDSGARTTGCLSACADLYCAFVIEIGTGA